MLCMKSKLRLEPHCARCCTDILAGVILYLKTLPDNQSSYSFSYFGHLISSSSVLHTLLVRRSLLLSCRLPEVQRQERP
ncbi:hypothetical protein Y1Q_0003472 [Alligator mississippiensis]|uniref:Uncharacterized protein n=1 Tax=Alligator mississippiensis TaxID=8496 RepID=A0A151M484_ALLMI|nr:hypothetical protein Y1Q_0003472 [Alligator mississippiensis]